jgi:hypothetical protein
MFNDGAQRIVCLSLGGEAKAYEVEESNGGQWLRLGVHLLDEAAAKSMASDKRIDIVNEDGDVIYPEPPAIVADTPEPEPTTEPEPKPEPAPEPMPDSSPGEVAPSAPPSVQ